MKLHRFSCIILDRIKIRNTIAKVTNITVNHLTPEIKLSLLTTNSHYWRARPDCFPFPDPFWAFYWAGGQALTRFVLDNARSFEGRSILDIGSGCGAAAIAAAKCKARVIYANDVDNVACEAISMNAKLNNCRVHIIQRNMIHSVISDKIDFIFVGDMFYDPSFAKSLFTWLEQCKANGSNIIIGDPGRYGFINDFRDKLKCLHEYALPPDTAEQNNGFLFSSVWLL